MIDSRGGLAVETLLKIVLGLIAVLLVLQILGIVLGTIAWLVRLLTPVLLLVAGLVVALWLLDRL